MKKRIAGIIALTVLLAATSCENALTGGGDHSGDNNAISATLANVRSAASDPAANCTAETAHYHNGVCYS